MWNILQDTPHVRPQNKLSIDLRRLKSYQAFFSDHNSMKLEINYKKKNAKQNKHMETKQHTIKQPVSQ